MLFSLGECRNGSDAKLSSRSGVPKTVDGRVVAAGTRAAPILDPRDTLERYAGIAYGTTGRPPERRRILTLGEERDTSGTG